MLYMFVNMVKGFKYKNIVDFVIFVILDFVKVSSVKMFGK